MESLKDPTETVSDEFGYQRNLHDQGIDFNDISADEYFRGTGVPKSDHMGGGNSVGCWADGFMFY